MNQNPKLLVILVTSALLGFGISKGISPLLIMGIAGSLILFLTFFLETEMGLYIVLAFLLVGITVPLGLASPYSVGKTADLPLYEILIPIFLMFLVMRKIITREKMLEKSPLNIPLFLWFTLIAITYFRNPIFLGDLLGGRPTGQLYHILYFSILDFCIYLSVIGVLKKEEQILKVTKMMFVIFVGVVVVSIIRYSTGLGIPGLMDFSWKVHRTTWGDMTSIRIGVLGQYSALGMVSFLCFRSFNLSRWIRFLMVLLFIFGVILSGGRTSLTFMIVAFLLFCIIRRKLKWGLGVTLGLLLFVLVLPHMPPSIRHLRTLNFLGAPGPGGHSMQGRLTLWRMALDVVRMNPIFGIGYGTFWQYSPFSFTEGPMLVASGSTHNAYLSVLVSYGVIGLVLFVWLNVTCLKIGWSLYKNYPGTFMRELMLWVTLYSAGTLITFLLSGTPYGVFNFFVFGVVTAVYALYGKQIQKHNTKR